jgi:hypothetical protein
MTGETVSVSWTLCVPVFVLTEPEYLSEKAEIFPSVMFTSSLFGLREKKTKNFEIYEM